MPKHRDANSGELHDKGGGEMWSHVHARTHARQRFKTLKEENRCFAAQTFLPQLSSTHLKARVCVEPFFCTGTHRSDFREEVGTKEVSTLPDATERRRAPSWQATKTNAHQGGPTSATRRNPARNIAARYICIFIRQKHFGAFN